MAATSSSALTPPARSPCPQPAYNDDGDVADGAGGLTFHRFGDLPYEIRHMIWRLALCSSRGIHFMKLSILSPEQHKRNLRTMYRAALLSTYGYNNNSTSADQLQSQTYLLHQQIQSPVTSALYHMWPQIWQHFHFHFNSPAHNGALIPSWNDAPIRDMARCGVRDVARARAARVALRDEPDALQFEPMPTSAAAPGGLTPILPTTLADDMSYFVSLDMEAAKLSATCPDAHEAVQRVMRMRHGRNDSLRLGRGGCGGDITRSWLMERGDGPGDGPKVPGSLALPIDDVVYLEYAESTLYARQWRIRMDIDCANLARIRHLALRYDPSWNRQRAKCIFCTFAHWFSEPYPTHLYQFLSRYFPNLETFYFLDESLKRRSSTPETDAEAIWLQPHFLSKGHTYWVANTDQWTLSTDPENSSSRVLNALDWLRTSFREYASTSMYNRHGDPLKVKFGVLAKENTAPPPPARQSRPFPTTKPQTRAQPATPGQGALSFSLTGIFLNRPKILAHDAKRLRSDSSAWSMLRKRRRQLASQRPRQSSKRPPQKQKQQPVWESGLPIRFGEGDSCKTRFTFRCERARVGKDIGWRVWFDGK